VEVGVEVEFDGSVVEALRFRGILSVETHQRRSDIRVGNWCQHKAYLHFVLCGLAHHTVGY